MSDMQLINRFIYFPGAAVDNVSNVTRDGAAAVDNVSRDGAAAEDNSKSDSSEWRGNPLIQ